MVGAKTACSLELFALFPNISQTSRLSTTLYLHAPTNPTNAHYLAYSIKKLFSLLLLFLGLTAQAHVTFRLTAVLTNTPASTTIYMAGSL